MRITRWGVGLVALLASSGARAQEARIDTSGAPADSGVNGDALPGVFRVEAAAPGYGSIAIVRGVIQSYSGDPVVATIAITPGDKELISKPDGTFQVELESGTYTLQISADGYRPKESELAVEAGGPVTILNIDLQKK